MDLIDIIIGIWNFIWRPLLMAVVAFAVVAISLRG